MKPWLTLIAFAPWCVAQSPIETYMNQQDIQAVRDQTATTRTTADLRGILPARQSQRFAQYVDAKTELVAAANLRSTIQGLRLNKLVGNTSAGSGTTNLVSSVAVPGFLGFASEYGSILQSTSGNTTTLRGNLLGITRMLVGGTEFPQCAEIDQQSCQPSSRWLRRFSGAIAFENVTTTTGTGAAQPANAGPPAIVDLFGNGFRMGSWSTRFDITSTDPSDPKYRMAWQNAMKTLKASPAPSALDKAVNDLFAPDASQQVSNIYLEWQDQAIKALQSAPDAQAFTATLERQLDILIDRMSQADPQFGARVAAVQQGFANYSDQRDALLRAIQTHKMSVEYTNQHPQNQAFTSNLRFIYSHQPSQAPTLITVNAALTWYNSLPAGVRTSRLRDVQVAGQLDRRLGVIPNFGNAVATFAAYYQWMKDDALIVIGPGNVAPGSGIVLPGTAATLLGTKGNIGVVQGKVSIPVNSVVKIPVSVTWSNRTELINEKDVRGQVGMTLDLDSIFKN